MPIKTNLPSLIPRRERFKREIELVSGGYVNPTAFPNGKCTVYPWDSAIDEWLTDYAKKGDSGTVLYFTVEKLCNLNGCQLKDFALGDVNTVLLVSRSIQNDSTIEYTATCPTCRKRTPERVKVPDELVPVGKKLPGYKGFDTITLPDCKDVVDVMPLRVGDELDITTRTPEVKAEIPDSSARVITCIRAVNAGIPDTPSEAYEWYMALSPKDARFLEEQQGLLTPHLDLSLPHQCEECGKVFTHVLALDEDFFRSGGTPNARGALEKNIQSSVGRKGADSKLKGSP